MISNWSNILARRDLLRVLVISEIKATTAQRALGWLWWLIDPLLMMLIYWAIVVGLLGRGLAIYEPYWLFIFFGLITWKHFSTGLVKSTKVLVTNQGLIKSIPFPTMVLPLSLAFSDFFFFLFGFLVLIAMSLFVSLPQHSGEIVPLVQIPALMLLQVAVVAGILLPLSCLGAIYRDLSGLMPHLARIGFYLSPGLYGVDLVRKLAQENLSPAFAEVVMFVYMLNPAAILIEGYRDSLFYGDFMEPQYWIVLLIEAAILLGVGYLVYQHYDRRVIKFL